MNKILFLTCFIYNFSLSCPTCIGLPRYHERPFFERKSFLAALEKPKAAQPQEKQTTSPATPEKK
jgi:hypothetical protein